MDIIRINRKNRHYVETFIENGPDQKHFRYFNHRDLSCLKNHLITLVGCLDNQTPMAYGHIDNERGQYWLGISVYDNYQRKGYGQQMMDELIRSFHDSDLEELFLTVDKDNMGAFNLYKKCGFVVTKEDSSYYVMVLKKYDDVIVKPKSQLKSKGGSFTLQVSCGEALDKLTILEIKTEKIHDHRLIEVKKEYDLLNPILRPAISDSNCDFLYSLLKQINLRIWDDQDIYRTSDISQSDLRVKLCNRIIEDNDQRFRIKNKINQRMNSILKEQKGYQPTKALVIPHLLMGDQIVMIPMVRYLSMLYDEVHLWAIKRNLDQLRFFYEDDPCIRVIECTDNWWRDPMFYEMNGISNYNSKDIYACGIHSEYVKHIGHASCHQVPFCFYNHCQLNPSIYWNYFYINETPNPYQLMTYLKHYHISEYIFIHPETSKGPVFDINCIEKLSVRNKDNTLFIDPNHNWYPEGHQFHCVANKFVNLPINDYVQVLINASQIYISDSCFFCLSIQLGIKTTKCYVRSRQSSYDYIWSPQYGFDAQQVGYGSNNTRKIFKPF
jgi:ribosomal protein S18 acetylase RimI-like enzyme